ncbi:MAG: glycosyltransferase 87 family protein [Streptosporangiaceae bacterium]
MSARTGRRHLLASILAGLVALTAVAWLVRLSLFSHASPRLLDLDVYREGGRAMLHGHDLYSVRSRDGLLFTYPPVAAVLAVPLAVMTWRVAQFAWLPMIYVPLTVAVWYSFRPLLARARGYAPAVFAILAAGSAYLIPLRQEIHYGQVDIFLVALCVLDCAVARPRWPRGALIGLATAIKLVPGVFIIYLFITGRRKAAGVASLSFAIATGVAWLLAPKDSMRYWTSAIFDSQRLGQNTQAANQSLRGMILRLFAPAPAPVLLWLALALVVAVAGFMAARVAARRGQEMAGVAITGLLAALLSPVAWIHHLCWVILVIGVLTGDGRNRRRLAAAAVTAALFVTDMPIWGKILLDGRVAPIPVTRFMEATFGLAAVALIGIIYLFQPTAADAGEPAAIPEASVSGSDGELLAGSRNR